MLTDLTDFNSYIFDGVHGFLIDDLWGWAGESDAFASFRTKLVRDMLVSAMSEVEISPHVPRGLGQPRATWTLPSCNARLPKESRQSDLIWINDRTSANGGFLYEMDLQLGSRTFELKGFMSGEDQYLGASGIASPEFPISGVKDEESAVRRAQWIHQSERKLVSGAAIGPMPTDWQGSSPSTNHFIMSEDLPEPLNAFIGAEAVVGDFLGHCAWFFAEAILLHGIRGAVAYPEQTYSVFNQLWRDFQREIQQCPDSSSD